MKLLKIDGNQGLFRDEKGEYRPIDKLVKEDLLRLVNLTLEEKDVEFDDYEEKAIKNQAHQIVYKSVAQKLQTLRGRRREFVDESERLYLKEFEKYREASGK